MKQIAAGGLHVLEDGQGPAPSGELAGDGDHPVAHVQELGLRLDGGENVQAPVAERAAADGKHVLLEKPVALSTAAADRVVDAVPTYRGEGRCFG